MKKTKRQIEAERGHKMSDLQKEIDELGSSVSFFFWSIDICVVGDKELYACIIVFVICKATFILTLMTFQAVRHFLKSGQEQGQNQD